MSSTDKEDCQKKTKGKQLFQYFSCTRALQLGSLDMRKSMRESK